MQGRQHLVGIKAHEHGLLSILRYAHELRSTEPYFEPINAEPPADVVKAPSRYVRHLPGPLIHVVAGAFVPGPSGISGSLKQLLYLFGHCMLVLVQQKVLEAHDELIGLGHMPPALFQVQ
jgi:hypothetical protein